jgi:glutamine amidotransferase
MTTDVVAVIDYGMGNLHSVASALEHAGAAHVVVTHEQAVIRDADRVVFPGVGAMRDCMSEIRRLHCDQMLLDTLQEQHRPVLAICVGMQALLSHSEENEGVDCLDIVPGEVRWFGDDLHDSEGRRLKVPHMGWNQVKQNRPHALWQGIESDSRFYFVHSYYADLKQRELVVGSTDYGGSFDVALARDNLFAVQFHPEKSHKLGLQLLRNFLNWDGKNDG